MCWADPQGSLPRAVGSGVSDTVARRARLQGEACPKCSLSGICWLLQVPPAPRLPLPACRSSAVNGYELQSCWHLPCPALAPRLGLARTVPPIAGELLDLGESLCLLLYLVGLEHTLDYPASLTPPVKR